MRKSLVLPSISRIAGKACGFLFALILCVFAGPSSYAAGSVEDVASNGNATMQLAAKIAGVDGGREPNKPGLVASYEKVYGDIGKVPARWPALVRRVLVCQQVSDFICVHSSMEAIDHIGGANTFALNHLFEVSRFGVAVETIRSHLRDAETVNGNIDKAMGKDGNERHAKAIDPVHAVDPTPVVDPAHAADPVRVADPVPAADPNASDVPKHMAPQTSTSKASAATATVSDSGAKTVAPRTLLQRASSRLGRMSGTNNAGFFLDALFAMVALSLLFAYLLFSAIRGRKAEHHERLRALQEVQRLEELRAEDTIRADHEILSERLKAEVVLEAEKANAGEILKVAQLVADEALQAERMRFAEELKAEHHKSTQLIQLEKYRTAEAIKAEQLKTEEAIKAAKVRADQTIDAYDQMAARELVYAHKQNDDLQELISAERKRREAEEMKAGEALQALDALKVREKKLLDIIHAEQRLRLSEARQAAEKLKAAQQAAAALQASLVATRALKADLEHRADEAMRAAEIRIAEAHQLNAGPIISNERSAQVIEKSSVHTPDHGEVTPATQENPVLKDAHGG